jgi:Tol biopolymer transport system component
MKKLIISIIVIISSLNSYSQSKGIQIWEQNLPMDTARRLFLGPFFENEDNRKRSFNLAVSPNGNEAFFSFYKGTPEKPEPEYEIKFMKQKDGEYSYPQTAPFSGEFWDVDINFSPDGNFAFFASVRPHNCITGADIYYIIKTETGWSEPISVGKEVNSIWDEVYPSISENNNLFFRSTREGGYGGDDLYSAEWIHGNFINVNNLGPAINTEYGESNAVVAPDESYILFCSTRPIDGNVQKIYISFKNDQNEWLPAYPLGSEVNNKSAGAPTLSADGSFLFFKTKEGLKVINANAFNRRTD